MNEMIIDRVSGFPGDKMAKFYVTYSGASHLIHKVGCPDMNRDKCVYLGDFYTLELALPVAKKLLFEEVSVCLKCLEAYVSSADKPTG